MSLQLRIDEVVLRGVPAEHAAEVRAALETRLGELAGRSGPHEDLDLPVHRARPMTAGSPAQLGAQVADAVWSAVGGGAG